MIKLWLFFFFVSSTVHAQLPAIAEAPEKLQQIAEDLEKSRLKIEAEELKQRKILSALYEINKKIHKAVSEKSKLQGERSTLEETIRKLGERLEHLDKTSSELRSRLAERLRAIHRLGGPSMARILFSAGSSAQLDRNLKILGLVASRDRDMMRRYRSVRAEIHQKKEKLDARVLRLATVERSIKDREGRLLSDQRMKSRLLDGVRKKKVFAMKNMQDLKEQTKKFNLADDAVLDLLLRPSFADQQGKLQLPVQGTLTRRFGPEKSPDQHWTIAHKGVQWRTSAPQGVRSVFDGTISWVGEIPGFGSTVIVDHGDHYYSVYSQISQIAVNLGDEIKTGQVIAQTDRSDRNNDNGLYFEIRHFSEPSDPLSWVKGQSL